MERSSLSSSAEATKGLRLKERAKLLGARALRAIFAPQIERERREAAAMAASDAGQARLSERAQTPPDYYQPRIDLWSGRHHEPVPTPPVTLPGVRTKVEAGPTIQLPDVAEHPVTLPGRTGSQQGATENMPSWGITPDNAGWVVEKEQRASNPGVIGDGHPAANFEPPVALTVEYPATAIDASAGWEEPSHKPNPGVIDQNR